MRTLNDESAAGFFCGKPALPQAYGYGIVIAFGLFFSVVTSECMRGALARDVVPGRTIPPVVHGGR